MSFLTFSPKAKSGFPGTFEGKLSIEKFPSQKAREGWKNEQFYKIFHFLGIFGHFKMTKTETHSNLGILEWYVVFIKLQTYVVILVIFEI